MRPQPTSCLTTLTFAIPIRIARQASNVCVLQTAGEGEQHEVEERAQGTFRPAATGPAWIVDPVLGSVGWRCALTILQSAGGGGLAYGAVP